MAIFGPEPSTMPATTKRVVLGVRIPTLKLKKGDTADLDAAYADKLLANGEAMLPEDAKALAEAEAIKAKAEETAKAAANVASDKLAEAQQRAKARQAKEQADLEEKKSKELEAKRKALAEKQQKGE